jgi:integrase
VIVYAGRDPLTGKDRRLRKTCLTYAEAQVELTRLQGEVHAQRHPRSDITVGEALAQWLEVADHQTTTRERYDDLIRLYLTPTFGSMRASAVDAQLLERFYARLQRCRELCTGRPRSSRTCRPLANNTVRKLHSILSAAFDRAVRYGQLGINPVELAEPPAFRRGDPDPPSPAEAAALLNAAWAEPDWGTFLWLSMVTGSRRGEMLALRWTHVDLDRGTVTVQRSLAQTRNGLVEKGTKSSQGRGVSLDDQTVEFLRAHRSRIESRCSALGAPPPIDGFVFSQDPDGTRPLLPRSVSQRYRRMATRLGLRSTRLHALRHYTATELLAAGADLRTVAGRLGHSDGGATTLRIYAGRCGSPEIVEGSLCRVSGERGGLVVDR